jgi:Tfp pilus assembly protein PilF
VSLLDLGQQEKAITLLEEALRCDPLHPEATFNHGIILLRAARISDETLLGKLRKVADADPRNSVPLQLVARVHLERGQNDSALLALRSAQNIASDEGELRAIKRLIALAIKPARAVPQEISRAFVHAVPRTGAEYSRDAAHVKRLLLKAHAAHKAGRADDARRYLMRLREIPESKQHPKVQQLEQILGNI